MSSEIDLEYRYHNCPQCRGRGSVDWGDSMDRCPRCRGAGQLAWRALQRHEKIAVREEWKRNRY